ncbi:DedA family protein [Cellulomonas sp. PhB143]|uniref:DedA family protein n=1 Tax=Cellulomonas sp. PhB143 TaxID=2485186 RepID=UPI000F922069|nr:VTT domain-containing protein [Cellulomonas sp. PhB143]ROS76553.1 membrane-associated protein [Cellulomonas sp. PhB143]
MHHALATSGMLDPAAWLDGGGVAALAIVCGVVFAETGLLLGFLLPGDTLLFLTGVLTVSGKISQPLWLVLLVVALATTLGGELGYTIGRRGGPAVFERRESGLFSRDSVERTQQFFDRFGAATVAVARFVAVVRTFAPVAAGVGRMRRGAFSAWNAVGAVSWTVVLIVLGYLLGSIPGVAEFVDSYLDVILVAVIAVFAAPVLTRVLVARHRRQQAQDASGA